MKITLKILGKLYTSEGKTLQEALENMKIPVVKGSSVLTYEKDGQEKYKVFNTFVTQNYFGKGGATKKEYATKRLKELLGIE